MPVLEARGLGVAWSTSRPILEDVSFTLEHGLCGLVGANGAGKTTLLAVMAGERTPTVGRFSVRPGDAVIAFCPQRVDGCTSDVFALAGRTDAFACALRGRLGVSPEDLRRWATLSPGERKRWQVGAALAREPDVLLLDEPTNHLDGAARARLLEALSRFSGVGVVVSHDRELLERATRSTLRLHDGAATLYPAPYGGARELWQRARREQESAHHAARRKVRRLEVRLDAARRERASAEKSKSARHRMRSRHDRDAAGMLATTRAHWAEARVGRTVEIVRGELERVRRGVPTIGRDPTLGGDVFASFERAPHTNLFHVEAPALTAGEHVVLRDVCLTVAREDRLRIEGDNGAGKTTLVEALLASRRSDRVLYLPQELDGAAVASVARRIAEADAAARGRVLAVFAALGSDPKRVLGVDAAVISPGEARKLVLADALVRHVFALVLDEPTNHLDLPSIEPLEDALTAYPGAVVLVTHDDAFARRVTTRSVRVHGGRVG